MQTTLFNHHSCISDRHHLESFLIAIVGPLLIRLLIGPLRDSMGQQAKRSRFWSLIRHTAAGNVCGSQVPLFCSDDESTSQTKDKHMSKSTSGKDDNCQD